MAETHTPYLVSQCTIRYSPLKGVLSGRIASDGGKCGRTMGTLDGRWRKSSYSGTSGGDCVETAGTSGAVLVRDTTDRAGVTLTIPAAAWQTFVTELR
jgi:hypothetical protein